MFLVINISILVLNIMLQSNIAQLLRYVVSAIVIIVSL